MVRTTVPPGFKGVPLPKMPPATKHKRGAPAPAPARAPNPPLPLPLPSPSPSPTPPSSPLEMFTLHSTGSYVNDVTIPTLTMPNDVAMERAAEWETCLLGCFIEEQSFSSVKSTAFELWGKSGLTEVLYNDDAGFFFFKFTNKETRKAVLEDPPWHFCSQPVFLSKWEDNMTLEREQIKEIPIWVRFYNLPMGCWSAEGLSYVAGMIGIPLFADKMTTNCKVISYARLCIEVSANFEFISEFDLEIESGASFKNPIRIRVEYEYLPLRCESCEYFGHDCTKRSKRLKLNDLVKTEAE